MATSPFKVENVTPTTADISLNGVVKLAIREGFISTNIPAGEDAPDTALVTMADLRISGGHLFQKVEHNGPLETIPQGCIPANGQKVYASMYPFQMSLVEAGHQFVVPEHEWQAGTPENPDAHKGKWSLGGTDAYGRWYRAPKWNADSSTGYRAPFLRGSEIGVDAGLVVGDAGRNLTGTVGDIEAHIAPNGAFKAVENTPARSLVGPAYGHIRVELDASRQWPVADEFRPRYYGVIMCIRMFGTVSNPGSVDAAQLATDLAIANAKIASLESELEESIGFTIIYPNGGSSGTPANVGINSTYLEDNPFPDFHILCEAEVLYSGIWAKTGWVGAFATGVNRNDFYGVNASVRSDNKILVTTGTWGLLAPPTTMGGGHAGVSGAITTPLPCRVKVWKVKGSTA